VIINGDDIAFCGDQSFYEDWVTVTSHFGLVVNREKSGVSSTYVELNSRSFLVGARGKVQALRKPVLSALQPLDDPSCLLTRLWDGLRTLSPGGFRRIVVELRNDIIRRGVCLSSIPERIRRVFVKERWFRLALLSTPRVVESGVKRAWPVVTKDVRPAPSLIRVYESAKVELLRVGVRLARGKKVRPWSCRLQGCTDVNSLGGVDPRVGFVTSWSWRWPAPLFDWWESQGLSLQRLSTSDWEDDHPDLSVSVVARPILVRFPPFVDPDALLVGSGAVVSDRAWSSYQRSVQVRLSRHVASQALSV
jgi:hypothetical protein